MSFEEIFKHINKPEYGEWMGRDDCVALYNYAVNVKGTIVEIGNWLGKSLVLLALSSPKSKVIGIDPYIGYDKEYEGFIQNIKGIKNITHIKKPSDEAYKTWVGGIDLLHIDGEHTYEQVKNDTRWLGFLNKDGVAMFHDFTAEALPGVRRAVTEMIFVFDTVAGFAVVKKYD